MQDSFAEKWIKNAENNFSISHLSFLKPISNEENVLSLSSTHGRC